MIDRFLGALARLLNHLPRNLSLAVGQSLGAMLHLSVPYRKDVAWVNLARALPKRSNRQRRSILFRCYLHYGMVLMDYLRLPTFTPKDLAAVLDFDMSHIESARARGKGALILAGHMGNWELAAHAINHQDYPFTIVIVRQRGPGGAYLDSVREASGTPTLSKKTPTAALLGVLRAGHFLGLAIDQDARSRGTMVTFFGRSSSRPKGPAIFALRTGAPTLLMSCLMLRDKSYQLKFTPVGTDRLRDKPVEAVRMLTQEYMDALQSQVERHPEQYFWFHRMWKTQPPSSQAVGESPDID